MHRDDVLQVLDALDATGARYWIAGGWGVDALVGSRTREHRDLDLTVDVVDFGPCLATLDGLGYRIETDWLPLRVEVAAPGGRWVDVHPVRFDSAGQGIQGDPGGEHFRYPPDAFTHGLLAERVVPCLSVSQQLVFHSGYEPRPHDVHDLHLLATLTAKN